MKSDVIMTSRLSSRPEPPQLAFQCGQLPREVDQSRGRVTSIHASLHQIQAGQHLMWHTAKRGEPGYRLLGVFDRAGDVRDAVDEFAAAVALASPVQSERNALAPPQSTA